MFKVENEAEKQTLIAGLYKDIMDILEIEETPDNADTPNRVAKALLEMTRTTRKETVKELMDVCTTFENHSHGILLEQDDIEFSSMCSHHHLPFFGKVKITYVAGDHILGLSKFNRIVEWFSNKPQVQEDMTMEIGVFLAGLLSPQYLKVELYDCMHSCMCSRGVKSRATTKTVFEYGGLKKQINVLNG